MRRILEYRFTFAISPYPGMQKLNSSLGSILMGQVRDERLIVFGLIQGDLLIFGLVLVIWSIKGGGGG